MSRHFLVLKNIICLYSMPYLNNKIRKQKNNYIQLDLT